MAKARDRTRADLIADALQARRDELISTGVAEIRNRMETYRRADPALIEDVTSHIGEHHDLLCAVLRRGKPAAAREFEFVGRHAALRARRGISLSDFLEAFRSYHNVVWDAVLDASRPGGEAADQALAAARTVIRHIDLATTEASAAYLEAQQLLVADGDRARRDLLEDLLAGRSPATAAGLAVARAAGLEGDGRCVLIAAVPTVAPEDEAVLRPAATTLAGAVDRGRAPLAVARHGEIVIVKALTAKERPSLRLGAREGASAGGVAGHGAGGGGEHGAGRSGHTRQRLPRGIACLGAVGAARRRPVAARHERV